MSRFQPQLTAPIVGLLEGLELLLELLLELVLELVLGLVRGWSFQKPHCPGE